MKNLILFLLLFSFSFCQAQIDTSSIYPNLDRKERPRFSVSTNGKSYYYMGEIVSKETYDYFKKIIDDYYALPHIRQFYHKDGWLESEAVMYEDCFLGWYKEFYKNKKIKVFGRYKEFPMKEFLVLKNDNEFNCFKKEGKWTYFATNGGILYFEFWEDGNFVRQLPEQKINEIWKLELMLDKKDITFPVSKKLRISDLNRLEFTPKYKNKVPIEEKIEIALELPDEINSPKLIPKYSLSAFRNLDFVEITKNRKGLSKENQWMLKIYNNNVLYCVFSFYFKE